MTKCPQSAIPSKCAIFALFVKEVVLNRESWPVFVHHIKEYVFICLCAMFQPVSL